MYPWDQNRRHHGIVLDASKKGSDMGSAAMGSIFIDDDDRNTWFLFYTGAQDKRWSKSAIGLAVSRDGVGFKKNSGNPMIEVGNGSFCNTQALNPAVIRVKNRFFMVLTGKRSPDSSRRIGIAYADDPKGPWHIIGELIKPSDFWEGKAIDNGCSIVKSDDETLLVYYSSLMSPKTYDVFTFLRRYPVRRIGILKVRIRGTSRSSIEAMRFSGNPLKHLNGPKGSWNESVYCPGYLRLNNTHYLFPAASTYSAAFPYRQYIGMVAGNSPFFHRNISQERKLIDGPTEKSKIISNINDEIALDTPTLHLNVEKQKIFLYYSVADRANEIWKTALTTFDLKNVTHD
jgi:hypothetical protein